MVSKLENIDYFEIEILDAEKFLSNFSHANDRLYFSDNLSRLFTNLYQNKCIDLLGVDNFNFVNRNYTAICHDTWGLFTIASRIQDSEYLFNTENLTDARFRDYLSLDLELLLYLLRSIFNYCNNIIRTLVKHPQLGKSFNDLLKTKAKNRKKLSDILLAFIDNYKPSNSFFNCIKQFRDHIDHFGGSNYIFLQGPNKEIHFSFAKLDATKPSPYPSRVNLKDYVCWLFVNYLKFREDLFEVILSIVNIDFEPDQDNGTYIQADAVIKWVLERHAPNFVITKKSNSLYSPVI